MRQSADGAAGGAIGFRAVFWREQNIREKGIGSDVCCGVHLKAARFSSCKSVR